jgi:hypothetical protein
MEYEEQSSMSYMQGDSWVTDITAGNDFLDLGDQKFLTNMSPDLDS